MFSFIAGGAMLFLVIIFAFQNGRAWGMLPEVMADAWTFSRRIGALSFAFVTMATAWYLWNWELDIPKIAGIWKIFFVVSVATWIYFVYLEMQSIKWETLLRESLCVMAWDTRMASLSPEEVDKVLTFLMANDDFLRAILQSRTDDEKSFIRTASLEFKKTGKIKNGGRPVSGTMRGKE